jgi:sarcosine oxidase subunit beta
MVTRAAMEADVGVVGGGVIGLSVARELARAGVERVVVLEREAAVGQGSSSRANGGVRAQFTTRANIEFSRYSIGELERLEADSGLLEFRQTGYLLMTGTEAGAHALREAWALQRSMGVETRWLTPAEILELAPFVRAEGLVAGTFHHRDGFLDPHGVVSALRLEAGRLGVRVLTGTKVTAIRPLGGPGSGGGFELALDGNGPRAARAAGAGDEQRQASAPAASLRARWVVNAAGPAAAQVAALAGADLPVEPVRRNLAFAREREVGDLIPMCVDLDTGVLVRRELRGGFVLAWSDPDDPPSWETTVDPRFLEGLAQRVGHRFPFAEDLPIDPRQCWAGLYPETPDHHAIVGEAAEVPGLVHCAGFGGHGVMHSPAAGKAVAELITLGRCTSFDLRPLRPSRFAEGDLVVETAVL